MKVSRIGFVYLACGALLAGGTVVAQSAPAAPVNVARNAVAAPTPAAEASAPAPVEKATLPAATSVRHEARRDPFVNPIVKAAGGGPNTLGCGVGKRCLAISQIHLKGVIGAHDGMLAIVENAALRTYFLRENDPLFDGVVERITKDTVVFRENVVDSLGRHTGTREVVKKVIAPAA